MASHQLPHHVEGSRLLGDFLDGGQSGKGRAAVGGHHAESPDSFGDLV